MKYYLAIDIGASSGRHIIGYKENGNLQTVEVYRFKNDVKIVDNHLTWDIEYLFQEVKNGIKKALEQYPNIESMSIDTWGVDYVLFDGDKEILPCYAYRDSRTKEVIPQVHEIIPFEKLYDITGSQFQEFNTIYQLYDDKLKGRLDKATMFLHIPEYFMYKLTGVAKKEYTNASTTGMLDGKTNFYSKEIIDKLGLKESLFTDLAKPKELVGYFKEEIAKEVNGNIKVVLCPTHDTASAVEGIVMDKGNGPYISSGTWSLVGIKVDKVITSKKAMEANYSNEYGPNYIRFQKNIIGLWIAQRIAKQIDMRFAEMVELAKTSKYIELFNANDPCFLASLDMMSEIKQWFIRNNITPPESNADYINTTFRSLAYSYKMAMEELESITNTKYDKIYIVGGGAKNQYLNELTKEYTGLDVIALPIEATAIGNLLTQMED